MSAEYLLLLKFLCTYIFFRFILDKKYLLSKNHVTTGRGSPRGSVLLCMGGARGRSHCIDCFD